MESIISDIENITLRLPTLKDGMNVYRLIGNCPPLDTNSSYCNLLQCSHFQNTSVVAEMGGEIVGSISGYLTPDRDNTLFIWQVAVAKQARGVGLASKMLAHILERSYCKNITYIETTISKDNHASWGLFKSFAKKLSADLQSSAWMDKETHFGGQHESEELVRIGPMNSRD